MFFPLHVKSDYSLGFGTASVDELVERAAACGFAALALTDIENLCGQVRFHHQCRARGLHPVTGLKLRPGFDGRRSIGGRSGRLVLLAENFAGYRSICRIVSRRRGVAGPRGGKGRLGSDPLPLVAEHTDGLFVLSDDVRVIERCSILDEDFHPVFGKTGVGCDDGQSPQKGRCDDDPVAWISMNRRQLGCLIFFRLV